MSLGGPRRPDLSLVPLGKQSIDAQQADVGKERGGRTMDVAGSAVDKLVLGRVLLLLLSDAYWLDGDVMR